MSYIRGGKFTILQIGKYFFSHRRIVLKRLKTDYMDLYQLTLARKKN